MILFGGRLPLLTFLHCLAWHLSAGSLIFNSVFVVGNLSVLILSHFDVPADVISAV